MKFHFRSYDHHHGGTGGVVVPTDQPSAMLVVDAQAQARRSSDFRDADHGGEYREPVPSEDGTSDEDFGLDASLYKGRPSPTPAPAMACPPRSEADNDKASGSSWLASSPPSPSSGNDSQVSPPQGQGSPSSSPSGSPTSKRALHLDHREAECPIKNPDPHSRPRPRQFFRLGRHKSRDVDSHGVCGGTSSSSEDEEEPRLQHGEHGGALLKKGSFDSRRKGIKVRGFRKLRRAQSLPVSNDKGILTSSERIRRPRGGSVEYAPQNSAESDPTGANKGHRRCVTFASVSVREYSTILGDHPCCPSGPPLSLGWNLEREESMEFERYEKEREPLRARKKEDMKLGGQERREILRSLVVTSTSAATSGGASSGEEGSDNDEQGEKGTAVYSQIELRRAERRLTRERASLNSRAHRRMNRNFFRAPLPARGSPGIITASEESEVSGDDSSMEGAKEDEAGCGSPIRELELEGADGGSMDISPAKSPAAAAMDDDEVASI